MALITSDNVDKCQTHMIYLGYENNEGKIMQNLNGIQDFNQADYEAEEQEQFDFFVDHEAVYDCDPYDVESYHAEAMLAYYD